MSVYSENKKYLAGIVKDLKLIPRAAALEIATRIFLECVDATPADSGQAMANWRIAPKVGGSFSPEGFEMMWGYGQNKATDPVGRKWSKGESSESVKMYQYEVAIQSMVAFATIKFDGIVVYNPLSASIPGFEPGNAEYYEQNSIGKVNVSDIIERAKAGGYAAVKSQFDLLK
jgi:hypothetical protein